MALSISSVTLGNGLRVVLVRDPQAVGIQVTSRYRVGAADDPDDKAGMAHLVEHLMFQQKLGSQSLFEQLESVATTFNAHTTFGSTTYMASADPAQLEKLLAIEAVRVGFRCTSITEEQFLRERDVVINEMRQRDASTEMLHALHNGLFAPGHPYRRIIGGTPQTVSTISFADACAFADAHYGTSNGVFVISGNVDVPTVERALGKFVGRIAHRDVRPSAAIMPLAHRDGTMSIAGPVDEDVVVLGWALPVDPLLATRATALVPAVTAAINSAVSGHVSSSIVGDDGAPVLIVAIERGSDSLDEIRNQVITALNDLVAGFRQLRKAEWLGELAFDNVQQSAIYRLYAAMEEGSERDERLASYVLAGREPREALQAEFQAVRELTAERAADFVRETFAFDRANVIAMSPAEDAYRRRLSLEASPHDIGPQREIPDPDAATRALTDITVPTAAVRTLTLPNGLHVVLMPMSSVPTIDIRLEIGAGTADEPSDRRGAALLAGYGLTFDIAHLNDMIRFYAAGVENTTNVLQDRTSFEARGVDMHADVLLAGLRRLVMDGVYPDVSRTVGDAILTASKRAAAADLLDDAWRAARYGADDPYTRAGNPRFVSPHLAIEDARAFRERYYAPDNATLIIAGHFDVALVTKWVEYLFGPWTGHATPPSRTAVATQAPAALALARNTSLMAVSFALPATAGHRAQRLVAAELLAEVVGDVRHRLGATYGVDVTLAEQARGDAYLVDGLVDPTRAADAFALLRDELGALQHDPDAAARAFVTARRRVVVRLRGVATSAREAGERIARDVELGRAPLSDLDVAREVAKLTIDDMRDVWPELDLSRAILSATGPRTAIDGALAAIARTPTFLSFADHAADDDDPFPAAEPVRSSGTRTNRSPEIEDALTEQEPAIRSRFTMMLGGGLTLGHVNAPEDTQIKTESCCNGRAVDAFIGYRIDAEKAVGLQLTLANLSGEYSLGYRPERPALGAVPVGIGIGFQASGYGRLWGSVGLGLHFDRIIEPTADLMVEDPKVWHTVVGVNLGGGIDALILGGHRLTVYGLVDGSMSGYGGLTLGAGYRYY